MHFCSWSIHQARQELGFYFTATMYEHKLSACKEDKVRKRLYDLQMNYLVGEGAFAPTSSVTFGRIVCVLQKGITDRCLASSMWL